MMAAGALHESVMLAEVVSALSPRSGGVYLDGTCGEGGHSFELLERSSPGGVLVAVDRDPEVLEVARRRLSGFGGRVRFVRGDFREVFPMLRERGERFDGIVLDLGISAFHLARADRGFSFRHDGPLDMRLDRGRRGVTAGVLVNGLEERDLRRLLERYGEEPQAALIARAIVRARAEEPLQSTLELARLIERVVPRSRVRRGLHPATRTFQALRIAVNDELSGLDRAVEDAAELLREGGRLVVLSFHSLEDRPVKQAMRRLARACTCPEDLPVCVCGGRARFRLIGRRAGRPSPEEVARNPRARSARMRVLERCEEAADE
jgi:16S rRNA (cytosine1402-N4)-methyltransferase